METLAVIDCHCQIPMFLLGTAYMEGRRFHSVQWYHVDMLLFSMMIEVVLSSGDCDCSLCCDATAMHNDYFHMPHACAYSASRQKKWEHIQSWSSNSGRSFNADLQPLQTILQAEMLPSGFSVPQPQDTLCTCQKGFNGKVVVLGFTVKAQKLSDDRSGQEKLQCEHYQVT